MTFHRLEMICLTPVNLLGKGLFWLSYWVLKAQVVFDKRHPGAWLLLFLKPMNGILIWILERSYDLIDETQDE